ncbi:MAG TPA: hypothetical protein VKC66_23445 [Xanthobacteraceae bacterium]|nr:hypothetical protein [Xanthobacteraceae bacterium]
MLDFRIQRREAEADASSFAPAHALAITAASLGSEQFKYAYQHWLSSRRAQERVTMDIDAVVKT